jgi:phage terminase Nu1 subunit (DNA packaging protein)
MGELIHLFARTEPWVGKLVLANYLGCSKRQVEKWTAEGMPSRMPGHRRVYRVSACEDWLEKTGQLKGSA